MCGPYSGEIIDFIALNEGTRASLEVALFLLKKQQWYQIVELEILNFQQVILPYNFIGCYLMNITISI